MSELQAFSADVHNTTELFKRHTVPKPESPQSSCVLWIQPKRVPSQRGRGATTARAAAYDLHRCRAASAQRPPPVRLTRRVAAAARTRGTPPVRPGAARRR